MDEFYNYMNHEKQRICTILNQNKALMKLTEEQNKSHEMVSRGVFKQTSLPHMSAFCSKLKMEGITKDEYKTAQEMWDTHKCEQYGRLSQCLHQAQCRLLADCMDNFPRVGIQEYGIDPAHCWTLAGYTWQCCLKMTNLELQLITDPNIYLMF